MKIRRPITTIILWLLTAVTLGAQPLCRVVQYDEEDGVPSSHVTQLLQDGKGFMWFATWNGLARYDGYEFRTFKPQVGDGCHMTTDRIRNMVLLDERHILCQVDDDYYMFDLRSYTFRDLTAEEQQQVETLTTTHRQSRSLQRKPYTWADSQQTQWTLQGDGRLTYREQQTGREVEYPLAQSFRTLTFAMADDRGNLWALDYGSIYKFTTDVQRTQRLDIQPKAEVKSLFRDSKGRCWVATKDDEAVRLYAADDQHLLGYLGADGRLHQQYTRFGAAVYCFYETKDGTLWLGTKPQGLFRLQPEGDGSYKIAHFTDIPSRNVYHITEDRYGRLWVATLGGGVCYTAQPAAAEPRFSVPGQYPKDVCQRARYFHITQNGVMLIATSSGLLTARLDAQADQMRFLLHQREPDRAQSLSSSATMDITEDGRGHLFVSTESGGVNEIMGTDLLKEQLDFRHINVASHELSSDMVQSLTMRPDGKMIIVGGHLISLMDSLRRVRMFDAHDFNADYRFSEAHPLPLTDGRWLLGLTDGAFIASASHMDRHAEAPRLVLTWGSVQEGDGNWAIENQDTLTLQPHERNLTVHFAALDYQAPERISYAFRLVANGEQEWNFVGHNRSVTLLDLKPGTYRLELRCTNADGEWQQGLRTLTIVVKPTFWEAWYGQVLIMLLIIGVLAAIAHTLLYIRRIKRQQHETLEKYLALIEDRESQAQQAGTLNAPLGPTGHLPKQELSARPNGTLAQARTQNSKLDPMLQRVMQFVEENISNSDVGVGDMAEAAATSRSGLQRKLKQTMGITPLDLMKEARIKRACQLLRESDKNVSEVAYACGFTDPKYFSRTFKQSTGKTPKEYRGH